MRWSGDVDTEAVRHASLPDHFAVLARAGALLSASLDYEETLGTVMEVATPLLGDFGFFDLLEPGSGVRRIARAPGDARKQAILDQSRWVRSERTDMNLCALSTGRPGVHPDIGPAWLDAVAVNGQHRAVMKDLDFHSMMSVPLRGTDGLLGALTLFFNRGSRRHDDAAVLLGLELASRAAAAVQNAQLFAQARQAIAARDELLLLAAHELRTPVTGLRLTLDTLLLRAQGGQLQPEQVVEKVGAARRQVTRLTSLLERILDISRIEAGVLGLNPEPLDLAHEVREAVQRLEPHRAQAGSALSVETEPAPGRWDRLRLNQAVDNLLHNAVKYGEGRPVRVSVRAAPGQAILEVQDHGIGISAADQERIFLRFERAASSRHYQGFGVGLWLAREAARAHGGTLTVQSAPGEGALFVLTLPAQPDDG